MSQDEVKTLNPNLNSTLNPKTETHLRLNASSMFQDTGVALAKKHKGHSRSILKKAQEIPKIFKDPSRNIDAVHYDIESKISRNNATAYLLYRMHHV